MPRVTLRRPLMFAATCGLLAIPSSFSDPVGVYALIDRVALAPNDSLPQSIQIWGVFALSPRAPGDHYLPAQRGYLYYRINPRNEPASRAEWTDLRAVAGTGQTIGFGSRFEPTGRVRRSDEKPAEPDVYPLGFGLVKTLTRFLGPQVERDLKRVP